jgi:hypothetical protein
MKKFFISLLLLISVYSYAADPGSIGKVSAHLKASLEKEFAGAQYVVWQNLKSHNLYHAKFIYNNERVNAFFEPDGSLVAIGRYILPASLPLMITKNVNHKYGDYQIKDATEFTRNGETSYLVTLENEKLRLVVQAYNSGSLYVFKKEKKNLPAKL